MKKKNPSITFSAVVAITTTSIIRGGQQEQLNTFSELFVAFDCRYLLELESK